MKQVRVELSHVFYVQVPDDCEDIEAFIEEAVDEELEGCEFDYSYDKDWLKR